MALLNRKKTEEPLVITVVPDSKTSESKSTPKKGHATPKRSDSQAARRKPIVASTASTNRPLTKEEKAAQRQKDRTNRDEAYEGMKQGVEKHLPSRDKGAQRRYVRQFVDARRNLGEYLMPVMFAFLFLTFGIQMFGYVLASGIFALVFWVILIAFALDSYFMWRKLKAAILAKYGEVERGTAYYSVMRAFQMRRMRMPLATARGQYPS